MRAVVKVTGLNALQKALNKMGAVVAGPGLVDASNAMADEVAAVARVLAPKRTGWLASNIETTPARQRGLLPVATSTVRVRNVDYARVVEYKFKSYIRAAMFDGAVKNRLSVIMRDRLTTHINRLLR